MTRMTSAAAILAGAITLGCAALAQEDGGFYVSGSGAFSALEDSTNEGAFVGPFTTGEGTTIPAGTVLPDGTPVGWTTEFERGWAINGAFGRRYGNLRGEVEVAYQTNDVDTHFSVEAAGIPLATEDAGVLVTGSPNLGVTVGDLVADGQGAIDTIFVMANAYYDFRNDTPLTPYVGAGLGVGFVDVNYRPSAVEIINDNATAFAWQAMAGVSWALAPNYEVFAGYRYRATTEPGVEASLFAADFDVENSGSIIEAGVRFSF